jgi:hypothetical protein
MVIKIFKMPFFHNFKCFAFIVRVQWFGYVYEVVNFVDYIDENAELSRVKI